MENEISRKIKALRRAKKMTLEQVADIVGVGKSTVRKWETGLIANMKRDKIDLIAKALSTSPSFLMGWDEEPAALNVIPVLGDIAAGLPIEMVSDILDYEEISPELLKDGSEYFALRIKGQSMEPKISDGDVVIVRKQEDVDSGQIAVVCVNGESATCKKVMKQAAGIVLQPLNPAFPTTFYTNAEIQSLPITILGRVIELRAKF